MQQITKYKSDDGREYDTAAEAHWADRVSEIYRVIMWDGSIPYNLRREGFEAVIEAILKRFVVTKIEGNEGKIT